MRLFWQDVPSEPNGILTFNDMVFNFRRVPAAVRALRFKKDSWGFYKFRLYGNIPFTGAIETNADNIMIVVSAFYLMERVFETLDDTDSYN